jgi:hypothetical protein
MMARTKRQTTTAAKADKYFREQAERLGEDSPKVTERGEPEPAAEFRPEPAAREAADKEALEKMVLDGVLDPFIARARDDAGFPFEPYAVGALNILAHEKRADYQRLRARIKTETDVPLQALEVAMKAAAAKSGGGMSPTGDDGLPGRAVSYAAIEPWPDAIDGAELLTELAGAIGAYVIMNAHQRDAVALWATFAHTHNLRDYAPLLVVTSPMKRCGKTRLQEALERVVPKPESMSGVSAALLPRLIERHRPTLLIDEFDAMMRGDKDMAEMLRGLLNSSFNRAGAGVLKLVPVPGGDWQERRFSLWAPACIGGIGKPPDTVEDRAVNIRLLRKLVGEKVKRLRGKDGGELDILRRKIARLVVDNEHRLKTVEPAELAGLNDRQQDAWEPLFAIAEVVGGDWPQRARGAATALCGIDEVEAQEDDVRLTLLADIRDIFDNAFPADHATRKAERAGRPADGPRLFTKQLLDGLHAVEERPWVAWGKAKKPLTDTGLAKLLRPFGVHSTNVRSEHDAVGKGYYLRAFKDAFARYVPLSGVSTRYAATNAGKQEESEDLADATNSVCSGSENARNRSNSGVCSGVAAEKEGGRGDAREYVHRMVIQDGASSPFGNDGGEDQ